MTELTASEADVLRHICAHGWVDEAVSLDRAKLAKQIEYLTSRPGCEVEGCPCLDFNFNDERVRDGLRATDEVQTVVVMDVKDSVWQANLFVVGGIIAWLEFSSFGDDYPTAMPAVEDLC